MDDLIPMGKVFNSASSDIDIEVNIILLEAKFRVINEVVLPLCSCDLLTVQALITQERFTDAKITITTEQEAAAQSVHFFAHKDALITSSPILQKCRVPPAALQCPTLNQRCSKK